MRPICQRRAVHASRLAAVSSYVIGVLLAGVVVLSPRAGGAAPPQQAGKLFQESSPPAADQRMQRAPGVGVIRSRFVRVAFERLPDLVDEQGEAAPDARRMALNMFRDVELEVRVERVRTMDGSRIWSGRLEGPFEGRVTLAVTDRALSGHVTTPVAVYRITYVGDGRHRVDEIDPARMPREAPPPRPAAQPDGADSSAAPAPAPHLPPSSTDSGARIDLLVVYTPRARMLAGGAAGMASRIATGVSDTNEAFTDSSIGSRIRLVHSAEVSYTSPSGDLNTDLNRLTAKEDGFMDEVHALRDAHRADLVKLIVDTGPSQFCGIAWVMQDVSPDFEAFAFSVTESGCIAFLTFAHELAHNLGSAHESGGTGAFSYSRAYVEPSGQFRTVMAVMSAVPRVGHFSNPSVELLGAPTGTPSRDNSRSINNTALTAANWREAATFVDVPPEHWAFARIEALYQAGLTGGCGIDPPRYCPDAAVTRAQLAVFLERGMRGAAFTPPPATGNVFVDVPAGYWAAAWIEQLFNDGITSGCGGLRYCPDEPVTRAQLAALLLKARRGPGFDPPAPMGVFADVPLSHPFAPWIEELFASGITAGCGVAPREFCPDEPVSRAQIAVFLGRAFNLDAAASP